jgi:putative endonuclease
VKRRYKFFVYIMASSSGTLYTGVTNSLERRILAHKHGEGSAFAARYRVNRLLYYEVFEDVRNAIDREKQIKAYRRSKKIALIESQNPSWVDRSAGWGEPVIVKFSKTDWSSQGRGSSPAARNDTNQLKSNTASGLLSISS